MEMIHQLRRTGRTTDNTMSQQQRPKDVNFLENENEEIYNQGERNTIKYMKTKEMIFLFLASYR